MWARRTNDDVQSMASMLTPVRVRDYLGRLRFERRVGRDADIANANPFAQFRRHMEGLTYCPGRVTADSPQLLDRRSDWRQRLRARGRGYGGRLNQRIVGWYRLRSATHIGNFLRDGSCQPRQLAAGVFFLGHW